MLYKTIDTLASAGVQQAGLDRMDPTPNMNEGIGQAVINSQAYQALNAQRNFHIFGNLHGLPKD